MHVFERASGLSGTIVRFGDEVLREKSAARATSSWLLYGHPRTVRVPAFEAPRFDAITATLAAETSRPLDSRSVDLHRHLLQTLLLWVERWVDDSGSERPEPRDPSDQLHRRFLEVLERDFAHHQGVGHYADQLAVPPAALSHALKEVTGRGTKALITDRVMIEAARLLRFSSLSVGEVAFRIGLRDQLYFSRVFKRHYGDAPVAYRERVRPSSGSPLAG